METAVIRGACLTERCPHVVQSIGVLFVVGDMRDSSCRLWNCSNLTCSYSMAAWIAPLCAGRVASVNYAVPAHESKSTAGIAYFGILNAVGQVAFAFAGHNVVLEIQASLPSTPETPSKVPMWRGCLLAYAVVALCYFPVAIVGYWAMGNGVGDNVLLSLGKPVWLLAVANLMVVIHVLGSYQVGNPDPQSSTMHDPHETFCTKFYEDSSLLLTTWDLPGFNRLSEWILELDSRLQYFRV